MATKRAYRIGKSISTKIDGVHWGRSTRIQIPQPEHRPITVSKRQQVETQPEKDVPWFMLHRRGVRRILVGEDPQEARAVSHDSVKGTLPERILYKLFIQFHYQPGVDFDFQSGVNGGRMELGGLVADFVFPYLKLIIQVQGPTHLQFRRMRKDEEQRMILEDMGYHVEGLTDEQIYNEYVIEEELRRIFNRGPNWAGASISGYSFGDMFQGILQRVLTIENTLETRYV